MAKSFFGPFAIRRVLGIGDREFLQPAVGERCAQVFKGTIGLERRIFRYHQDDPPDGVEDAFIPGETVAGEVLHIGFVGGEIEIERGTLADLPGEIAGRAEGELDGLAGFCGERFGDFRQGELQIGSGGDGRRLGGGGGPGGGCQRQAERKSMDLPTRKPTDGETDHGDLHRYS